MGISFETIEQSRKFDIAVDKFSDFYHHPSLSTFDASEIDFVMRVLEGPPLSSPVLEHKPQPTTDPLLQLWRKFKYHELSEDEDHTLYQLFVGRNPSYSSNKLNQAREVTRSLLTLIKKCRMEIQQDPALPLNEPWFLQTLNQAETLNTKMLLAPRIMEESEDSKIASLTMTILDAIEKTPSIAALTNTYRQIYREFMAENGI